MLFKSLAGYLAGNTAVVLSVADAKDGKISVTVVPKPRQKTDGDGAPLTAPLVLTGTPEEIDREFQSLVARHVAAQSSLAEQLEATVAVLNAAKQAAGSKAATAIAKPVTSKKSESAPIVADEDDIGDETPASLAAPVAAATADSVFTF